MFIVEWSSLPSSVEENISEYCGYNDSSIPTLDCIANLQDCLSQFNGCRHNGAFAFESEMHYLLFVLRWS